VLRFAERPVLGQTVLVGSDPSDCLINRSTGTARPSLTAEEFQNDVGCVKRDTGFVRLTRHAVGSSLSWVDLHNLLGTEFTGNLLVLLGDNR